MPEIVEPTLAYAQQRDREDELQSFRSRFCFPPDKTYFCGNSLGLQPRDAEAAIRQELADWRDLAIDGYWQAKQPWMTYPQSMRGALSRLAGCLEGLRRQTFPLARFEIILVDDGSPDETLAGD